VRAWRGLGRFRGDSTLSTWLHRIVTRRCLDAIASRPPVGELATDSGAAGDPVDAAEQRDRLRAVTRAISELPRHQRTALVRREFEGLSYDELARALDASVPAVKGRIHRARLTVVEQTAAW
jgi:RNA polymerase sigma-70 factor, ECF subfamily